MTDSITNEDLAAAWQEGYDVAHEMARKYGHVDSWHGKPENVTNPYVPKRVTDWSEPDLAVVLVVIKYDDDSFATWSKVGFNAWEYLDPEGYTSESPLTWAQLSSTARKNDAKELTLYTPFEVR